MNSNSKVTTQGFIMVFSLVSIALTCFVFAADLQGIISSYSFENNVLDNLNLNSGINHNATYENGISGKAISFDGVDDYVSLGNSSTLNPSNAMSIATWVYLKDMTQDYEPIVSRYKAGFGYRSYGLDFINYGSGDIRASFQVYNNTNCCETNPGFCSANVTEYECYKYARSSSNSINLNEWNYIVGTYNSSGKLKIYLNGELQEEADAIGLIEQNSEDTEISGYENSLSNYMNGLVDELQIYSRELTAEEILNAYSDVADYDRDNLTNDEENILGTNLTNADTDSDGINDYEEVHTGNDTYITNATNADTDSDGMPDGWEVENSLNPTIDDSAENPDLDGYTNIEEYENGTDPHVFDPYPTEEHHHHSGGGGGASSSSSSTNHATGGITGFAGLTETEQDSKIQASFFSNNISWILLLEIIFIGLVILALILLVLKRK